MLIGFRATNFLSFRDELELSLHSSKDKTLQQENTVSSGFSAVPPLLRSAAIYGANAAGKSNVIKAFQVMQHFVLQSATGFQPGQAIHPYQFRLSESSRTAPTQFEIEFIAEGVRYRYSFSFSRERIESEELLVYRSAKPQRWFSRLSAPDTNRSTFEFGNAFKGNRNVWEDATRPNALFLSTAVTLNSEALQPVFDWFMNGLAVVIGLQIPNPALAIEAVKNNNSRFLDFILGADLSIREIQLNSRPGSTHQIMFNAATGETQTIRTDQEVEVMEFIHKNSTNSAVFDLAEESEGTQRTLFLAGAVFRVIENGATLVIDELDKSLHPHLIRRIVELFHSAETNPKGAQLIFTTHDVSLLDSKLFRRDQIWFVSRDSEHASRLYPLSDYSPRKGEALERGYLLGRYGAVPFFE